LDWWYAHTGPLGLGLAIRMISSLPIGNLIGKGKITLRRMLGASGIKIKV
jgi:hypothetical protein